jgi:signal transduction histidine kinase
MQLKLEGKMDGNIEFVTDFPIEVRINVDSHRIRQVLANLLNNAIQFTDKGTISVRVENTAAAG